jgi:hypothetical protein
MSPIGPVSPHQHVPVHGADQTHYNVGVCAQNLKTQIDQLSQTLQNLTLSQANDPDFIQQTASLVQQLASTAQQAKDLC